MFRESYTHRLASQSPSSPMECYSVIFNGLLPYHYYYTSILLLYIIGELLADVAPAAYFFPFLINIVVKSSWDINAVPNSITVEGRLLLPSYYYTRLYTTSLSLVIVYSGQATRLAGRLHETMDTKRTAPTRSKQHAGWSMSLNISSRSSFVLRNIYIERETRELGPFSFSRIGFLRLSAVMHEIENSFLLFFSHSNSTWRKKKKKNMGLVVVVLATRGPQLARPTSKYVT